MHSGSDHARNRFDSQESYLLTADFLRFFSNSTVMMILGKVRRKEMTPFEIAETLGMSPCTVLNKLKTMEREGILVSSVRSQNLFFRVTDSNIMQALDLILEFPKKRLTQAARYTKSTVGNNGNGHK
jgi:DNA-binding transcriptional ArsR family regulator